MITLSTFGGRKSGRKWNLVLDMHWQINHFFFYKKCRKNNLEYCTWPKWVFLCDCVVDTASTSATFRIWYEKSNSSKCSCCPSKYIMVQPPQATESPSISWLFGCNWTDCSRYPYGSRIKNQSWRKISNNNNNSSVNKV